MAESKKQEEKEAKKAEVKKAPEFRLILPGRKELFEKKGWKVTGKTSKSGELIEVTK